MNNMQKNYHMAVQALQNVINNYLESEDETLLKCYTDKDDFLDSVFGLSSDECEELGLEISDIWIEHKWEIVEDYLLHSEDEETLKNFLGVQELPEEVNSATLLDVYAQMPEEDFMKFYEIAREDGWETIEYIY